VRLGLDSGGMQLPIPFPALLGILYGLSEAALGFVKRSRDDSVDADDSTLRVLWIVILVSVTSAIVVASKVSAAHIGTGPALLWPGCALFAFGIVFRWYSIIYLGRFFTVNVAIHSGHEVIDTGPYRRIRHPSYTGSLLAFLGLGITLENWLSILLIVVPVFWAFARRMTTEENALADALGAPYTNYMQRTKRLVPYIY
jgi:protein-S-isoprenylcysteine O-methyltransferase